MDETDEHTIYRFFTEIGIINQLSRSGLERHLPGSMTATQFGILGHLMRRPEGETPLQLATAFQVPKTSMTHMITGLVDAGLIEIAPNPKDGRSKIARVTPMAGPFFGEVTQKLGVDLMPVIQDLGVERFARVLPDLEKIRSVMDKARDAKHS